MTTTSEMRPGQVEEGRARRREVPRGSHAEFTDMSSTRDPVDIHQRENEGRIEELLPIRHERMLESPLAFYRGSAAIMAHDLATTPDSGVRVQICGDAHLSNFGLFATPERHLAFSVNDFDETLPGPWEWDVKRLTASVIVAGQDNGLSEKVCRQAARSTVREYRLRMWDLADTRLVDTWLHSVDAEADAAAAGGPGAALAQQTVRKSRRRNHLRALARLAEVVDGKYRIRHDPPLVLRTLDVDEVRPQLEDVMRTYVSTLPEERRPLIERYRFVDVAMKVVGVGSVGTRCWIALFESDGSRPGTDPLFLQVKEAGPSVLEPFLGPSEYRHPGHRVVIGQRLMQSFSDVFLGWTDSPLTMKQHYVRQLHDMKGSLDVAQLEGPMLAAYGAACSRALSRAHARSGHAAVIAGYLGSSSRFEDAVAEFAARYAGQNRADYDAFVAAAKDGRIVT